ncbi:uncharacterized protein LOC144127590 isoform X1 [Amblyomma americanum]
MPAAGYKLLFLAGDQADGEMIIEPRIVVALALSAVLLDTVLALQFQRPKRVRVLNGRCIYRGKSVREAYITQADGKCVEVRCKPKQRRLYFNPMKECMLPPPGKGCFYQDGLLENVCCKPNHICY